MKKAAIVTLVIVVIAALVGGYIYFNRKAKAKKEATEPSDTPGPANTTSSTKPKSYSATADAATIRKELKEPYPNSATVTNIIYKLTKDELKKLAVAYETKYGIKLYADLQSQTGIQNLQIAAVYVKANT